MELLWNDPQIAGVPGPATFGAPITSLGGVFVWIQGTGTCLAASCLVLDEVSPLAAFGGSAPDLGVKVHTLTMVADALGLINFSFGATALFGAVPTFGGNAATAEVVVPEPGTAALLGLGLTGLAVARRRCMSLDG